LNITPFLNGLKLNAFLRKYQIALESVSGSASVEMARLIRRSIFKFLNSHWEAIPTGSSEVMAQIIADLAMKVRQKEILCWYCYYKAYEVP
jgi:hypothetical protein